MKRNVQNPGPPSAQAGPSLIPGGGGFPCLGKSESTNSGANQLRKNVARDTEILNYPVIPPPPGYHAVSRALQLLPTSTLHNGAVNAGQMEAGRWPVAALKDSCFERPDRT